MTDETAEELAFFATSEGLRTTLTLLDELGPDGWRLLPAAGRLLAFARDRYAPVARSWGRPVEEAATAAFLVMRTASIRNADDPWAAVTRGVELHMMTEATAERGMISPERARRAGTRPDAAPVRAGEHEFLYDLAAAQDDGFESAGQQVERVVAVAAEFLTVAGWESEQAHWAVEYVCSRMADLGSQDSALDALRRDDAVRLRLGASPEGWAALLRVLIGTRPSATSKAKPALLARVVFGEQLRDLLEDSALVVLAAASAPTARTLRDPDTVERERP